MSSPLYLQSWDRDIYVIEVGTPGPPGTGFTPAEAVQVRDDLDELLSRPEIDTLESLTNVPDTGAVNGQTIVKATGGWVYGNPNSSLTRVNDSWSGEPPVENATIITTGTGIKVTEESSGSGKRAHMALQFAGTGSEGTVARSDHQHNPMVPLDVILPYQGVLSTGFRTLYSDGFVGLSADRVYDIFVWMTFDVVAAGVNSTVTPRIGLGGGALDGYQVKFSGHGKNVTVANQAIGVTGVTNYPLLARVYYQSGPQIEIGAGQIFGFAKPRR